MARYVGHGASMNADPFENLRLELRRGSVVLAVLAALRREQYGYTLRKTLSDHGLEIVLIAPTTHFVSLAQAILYRGAGFSIVWPQFLAILGIAVLFFAAALVRFRKSIGTMQS
jgi:ABC-2 type transport system permease protein